jgi:DNA-binding NarL/FixJ family response regulator
VNRTRLILVEDDDFTRSMIAGALQIQGFDIVGEASSAAPAMQMIDRLKPDAVVVDLDLGVGPNGIDLAIGVRRKNPRVGIVLLTTYEDPRLLSPGLPKPPFGTVYLIKKNVGEIEVLYKGIQKAISNMATKSSEDLEQIYGIPQLTDSQLETMRLVAQGLSNAEIAKKKSVTEKSIEQSISRLVGNLNLPSGPENNQRVQISKLYYKLTGSKAAREET